MLEKASIYLAPLNDALPIKTAGAAVFPFQHVRYLCERRYVAVSQPLYLFSQLSSAVTFGTVTRCAITKNRAADLKKKQKKQFQKCLLLCISVTPPVFPFPPADDAHWSESILFEARQRPATADQISGVIWVSRYQNANSSMKRTVKIFQIEPGNVLVHS